MCLQCASCTRNHRRTRFHVALNLFNDEDTWERKFNGKSNKKSTGVWYPSGCTCAPPACLTTDDAFPLAALVAACNRSEARLNTFLECQTRFSFASAFLSMLLSSPPPARRLAATYTTSNPMSYTVCKCNEKSIKLLSLYRCDSNISPARSCGTAKAYETLAAEEKPRLYRSSPGMLVAAK